MMSRYLILGLPKTGTTVLFHKIKNALPGRYKTIFERYDKDSFCNLDETVVAKMLINPKILNTFGSWENFDKKVLKQFDKIIYLTRDPRDRLVSSLLFSPQQEYKKNLYTSEQVHKVVQKLRKKELDPLSVNVRDLETFYFDLKISEYVPKSLPNQSINRGPKHTTDPYLLALELHNTFPNLQTLKYEDMMDEKLEEVEEYLSLKLEKKTDVGTAFSYVKRSAGYGAWKAWFTPSDVQHFQAQNNYGQYMQKYGYTDWTLHTNSQISPSTSSEYVLKNYHRFRENKKQYPTFKEIPFIISGFERSGTTLVSEIFRQHPKLDSGFEVGALLFDTPKTFFSIKPEEYYVNLLRGWEIDEKQLQHVCDTYSWDVFYQRLRDASPLIENKNCQLFDKTPKYMLHLNSLLTTHPRMKAIVTTKNPVRLFFSWARRGIEFRDKHEPNISIEGLVREKLDTYAEHFHHYFEGLNEAYQIHGEDRILPVPYEKLCRNPAIIAQKMFDFTGYSFHKKYLRFDQKYSNIHQNFIDPQYVDEFAEHLSPNTIQEIHQRTTDVLDFCPPEFFDL